MHLFMHLHEQGRAPRGEAGWARNTLVAAPEDARGQGEPVGLVQGARRYQGPPSGATCTVSRWPCAASVNKRAGGHRGRSLPG